MADTKTLREVLSDLLEARSTLACMAQPQLVALDRAVERIEAIAAQAQGEPVACVTLTSAAKALNHLSIHNGPGRLAEASAMLHLTPQPAAQAQAEPYGWAVTGGLRLYFGEFAEHEAKEWARIFGGTAEALPLYRHTKQPVRQPLTDERITQCWGESQGTRNGYVPFARAVERAHGIGQEGAQQ